MHFPYITYGMMLYIRGSQSPACRPDPARGACQSGPRYVFVVYYFVYIVVLTSPYVLALLGFTGILSGPSREKFGNLCYNINDSIPTKHLH